VDVLDLELLKLTTPAVVCRRCGTPYPEHGDAGGPVTVRAGAWAGSPGLPLLCRGFQWVDPVSDSPTYG
jgi:hypothetical protein